MHQQRLDLPVMNKRRALEAAHRRVPGLAQRMSLDEALTTECIARCLEIMAGLKKGDSKCQ